jgi:hypothetical protein
MIRLSLLVVTAISIASLASAQQDSLLREAVRLATEGQGDSARVLVKTRIGELSPADSLYPEALYVAGVVAQSSDSALAYFRRVSIEFSRSEWADDALLRRSELAFAAGELSAAARYSETILLDYPFSGALAKAAYWAGRSHLELGAADTGCGYLRRAEASAGEDVELANRARYFLQRCAALETGPDSARAQGRARLVYAVQVAAVQSAAAANELMQQLHGEGYDSHVVRDSDGLLKVRVGRFSQKAQAQELAVELRAKLGGQPFVVEERR